jgi:hypothetical protein
LKEDSLDVSGPVFFDGLGDAKVQFKNSNYFTRVDVRFSGIESRMKQHPLLIW